MLSAVTKSFMMLNVVFLIFIMLSGVIQCHYAFSRGAIGRENSGSKMTLSDT
jgi:hypothetical protein